MAVAMFSHLPGRGGSRGRDTGGTPARIAPRRVRSTVFILVGRSAMDQSLRPSVVLNDEPSPSGKAGATSYRVIDSELIHLLTKDFVTLEATGVQPVGGREHGQRLFSWVAWASWTDERRISSA